MKVSTIVLSLALATGGLSAFGKGTLIFDGKSLDGWHHQESFENDKYAAQSGNFFAKDGALHCFQLPDKKGALLLSDGKYGDFELTMEIKADWGCDSGIFLRCNEKGQGIQILNDYLKNGSVGFIFGQGTGGYISRPILLNEVDGVVKAKDVYDAVEKEGLIYAIDAKGWNKTWKVDDWNKIKIRCVGTAPHITTWINGVKIMELDGSTYSAPSLRSKNSGNWDAKSAWDSEKVQAITGNKGSIAFQVHPGGRWKKGGSSMYRNIRIKDLTTD
ncbi:3-keto-disaccharide hydrolase [Pelagicoccus mobilis]|uniref:DUF1080 domain-containing protein n=1 Tax=Pelagicoccus mobilis TaxID=415221 RepID=A0A934RWM4_9BACT|nr:DUF1080 domain-containing protein [Pelagicoccus mobilis]MBK1877693.1 DUF1080 domain-containing protein [Pelagicoccus mobilis]